MKPVSDSEFDKLFQQRVEEANLQFDESAWDNMEHKLKKKERLVFFRNGSLAVLFLVFGASFYFLSGNKQGNSKKSNHTVLKKNQPESKKYKAEKQDENFGRNPEKSKDNSENKSSISAANAKVKAIARAHSKRSPVKAGLRDFDFKSNIDELTLAQRGSFLPQTGIISLSVELSAFVPVLELPVSAFSSLPEKTNPDSSIKKKDKSRNTYPITLAFSAGPDYNSTKTFGGDRATLNLGLLLQTKLYKRLSISTGMRYGLKAYAASAMNYELNNPGYLQVKKYVTNIDGSCNVLEVPLRLSYNLRSTEKNSISFNAGLSSYFMLKEKYVFYYTPESKIPDYIIQERNENRHFLGVADLSATYSVKLKNSPFNIGLEPYVKLPLGGVGEGKIRLKSSGINLNLSYDLHVNKH